MSGEAARTTAKSKMELSATILRRKSLPTLHGTPRYPQLFLKNMLKLPLKLNEIIKSYLLRYRKTR